MRVWTSPPPSSSAVTSSPVAARTRGGPPRKMVPWFRTMTVSSHMAGTYAPPAVHEPRARRLVVVAAVRRQRRELEEGRPGVEEVGDALARQELAARGVAAAGLVGPAEGRARARRAQRRHQALHVGSVGAELGI